MSIMGMAFFAVYSFIKSSDVSITIRNVCDSLCCIISLSLEVTRYFGSIGHIYIKPVPYFKADTYIKFRSFQKNYGRKRRFNNEDISESLEER